VGCQREIGRVGVLAFLGLLRGLFKLFGQRRLHLSIALG
jgi:hypothetical protein